MAATMPPWTMVEYPRCSGRPTKGLRTCPSSSRVGATCRPPGLSAPQPKQVRAVLSREPDKAGGLLGDVDADRGDVGRERPGRLAIDLGVGLDRVLGPGRRIGVVGAEVAALRARED